VTRTRLNADWKSTSGGDIGRYIHSRLAILAMVTIMGLPNVGCVRRKLTVNTEPAGAVIWLNDEEIGRSPATVDFLWYGDYDVVARLKGYETLRTHHRLVAPWYQAPGIDFIAEVLYPGWIVDSREMQFELSPQSLPTRDALLDNARLTRELALADPNQDSATDVASDTEPESDTMHDADSSAAPDATSEFAPRGAAQSTTHSNVMTEIK